MNPEELIARGFEKEFVFTSSRSSGPGGQNVNKVNSKVELRFKIEFSFVLTDDEKELLYRKLKNKINTDGELILVSQVERSQLLNKKKAIDKFYELVSKALTIPLKRGSTRPTLSSRIRRLEDKKSRGTIKKLRRDSGDLYE